MFRIKRTGNFIVCTPSIKSVVHCWRKKKRKERKTHKGREGLTLQMYYKQLVKRL